MLLNFAIIMYRLAMSSKIFLKAIAAKTQI